MQAHYGERLLAINLRARRFGYVAIEDSILIDSGLRHYSRSDKMLAKRLIGVLRIIAPHAVVLGKPSTLHTNSLGPAVAVLRKVLRKQGVPLKMISKSSVRNLYRAYGAANKHEVGMLIANCMIPELRPMIPPKRRPWETEHHRAALIDAAVIAICYLGPEYFDVPVSARRSRLS